MLKTRITVEEYDEVTERDPRVTELVDGEIVVNEPRYPHCELQGTLIGALYAWCRLTRRAKVGGPTEVRLTEHDSYGPDVVVVPRQPRLTDRETLADPPLLCVEIRSPSTWRYDIGRKKTVYERHGVPELWLVDGIAETVLTFARSADSPVYDLGAEFEAGDTLTSFALPGFALPLAELFER